LKFDKSFNRISKSLHVKYKTGLRGLIDITAVSIERDI